MSNLLGLFRTIAKNPRRTLSLITWDSVKSVCWAVITNDPEHSKALFDDYIMHIRKKNNLIAPVLPEMEDMVKGEIISSMEIGECDAVVEHPVWDEVAVSIVVPVYNQWAYTYQCLLSIKEHCSGVPYEIILADDCSTDQTRNATACFPNINVVRTETNLGFIGNCNNGARRARGKYVLFLNNDTIVQPGWLESLHKLMEREPSIGVSGSKLIYSDGTLQEAGGIIWKDASGWNYGRLSDPREPEFNYVKEVDYISGASIMVRRDLWEKVGGFDTYYAPAYFEDVDLAFRARELGYKVVFQPASVVVHFEGKSHGTDENAGIKKSQTDNRPKFLERWKETLERDHFSNANDVFWARDRSRRKKTILFIDHYVPHFDKDAGSRSTSQYVKMFVEKGFNVKFLPDNFYPHKRYTAHLLQMGVEVLYGNRMANGWQEWLKENADYIDVVYMHRPHISKKYMDFCKKNLRAKILYQCHDLHFLRTQREAELSKDPALFEQAREFARVEGDLFNKADVGLTFSSVELKELNERFPEAHCCQIPLNCFEVPADKVWTYDAANHDIIFVGGFGHSPNADAVRWFVHKVFPKVLRRVPDARFRIIGSNCPVDLLTRPSKHVEILGSVSDEELGRIQRTSRLNVVPLRYGAGVKGKVVESLYRGLPLVATSIGLEGLPEIDSIVRPMDAPEAMADEIVRICRAPQSELEALSAGYREYAWKYFSQERAFHTISPFL